MNAIKINVFVRGGMVQGVSSDQPEKVSVVIVDWDSMENTDQDGPSVWKENVAQESLDDLEFDVVETITETHAETF